jgi:DNA-binding MarR family transcriptional regulator
VLTTLELRQHNHPNEIIPLEITNALVYAAPVQAELLPTSPPAETDSAFASEALALLQRISRLNRHFSAIVTPILEQRLGLGLKELMVFGAIARGHTHPGQISSVLGLPPPTTSRLLEGLIEVGYLRRDTVPGDLRRFRMELTDKGTQTREQALRLLGETLGRELAGVPEQQLGDTIRQLSLLELSLGITEDQ